MSYSSVFEVPFAEIINAGATGQLTVPNLPIGSGAGRTVDIAIHWNSARFPTITSATLGGEAVEVLGSPVALGYFSQSAQALVRRNPTVEGNQSLVVNFTSNDMGDTEVFGVGVVLTGENNDDAPTVQSNSGNGSTANLVASVTGTGETGGREVFLLCAVSDDNGMDATSSDTNYTKRGTYGSGFLRVAGDADGAASVAASATLNNGAQATGWAMLAVSHPAPGESGPPMITEHYQRRLKRPRAA